MTCLQLEAQDLAVLRENMPKNCYYYHLAAALLNSSIGLILCPIEIIHNAISMNKIRIQACDFFANYGMHPGDIFERGEFLDKISRSLNITSVEADILAN